MSDSKPPWRENGVRIIRSDQLNFHTPQTPGMNRAAAINSARAGAHKLWAGTVTIQPNAKTGPHHHGALESIIYVVRGRARMRWGEQLEYWAEAGPGDFIFVPPFVPHQEMNAQADQPLECVVVRSDQEPIVVNLDIRVVERPEQVNWIDPAHPKPGA
ncbi:MAG: cupin domain-containing protein [Nitrospirota bacterium]